jgi:3-dehydroshikimate dehydratase
MLLPGMVSVTFRSLSPRRIIELAAQAKLAAIEWGGDVHVPHGDLSTAMSIRRMCESSGIAISAYGSYFRADGAPEPSAAAVVDTAAELGTGIVRVWAGVTGSAATTPATRAAVVEQLVRCCDMAAARNLFVAVEFHGGTLADHVESCDRLLDEVNRPNFRTFWQPPNGMDCDLALAGLRRIRNRLAHMHVFHWYPDQLHRLPLVDGQDHWLKYLKEAVAQSAIDGETRYAALEFVRDDSVDQFQQDAAALRGWLERI